MSVVLFSTWHFLNHGQRRNSGRTKRLQGLMDGWIFCGWSGRGTEKIKSEDKEKWWERAKRQKPIAWSYIQWLNIFFCSKKRGACAVGGPRWGGVNLYCLNSAAIYYSSKASDARRHFPVCVCDRVSQNKCEGVLCFCTFCANISVISLTLTQKKTTAKPHSRPSSAWNHIRPRYELSHRGKSE